MEYESPGTLLRGRMQATGMTQTLLAKLTELSIKHIHNLCSDKAPISPAIALKLEHIFNDIPAEEWATRSAEFQVRQLRDELALCTARS